MKSNLITFLVIVLLALSGYAQTVKVIQGDRQFVSKEGRFSVILPVGLENLDFSSETKKSELGEGSLNSYSQTTKRGNVTIGVMSFPESAFNGKTTQQMLDDAVTSLSSSRVISGRENITIDGYSAANLDTRGKGTSRVIYNQTIIIIAKPRIYTLQFSSYDPAELKKADVKKYFSSFRIEKLR